MRIRKGFVVGILLFLSSCGGFILQVIDEDTWYWRDDENPNALILKPLRLIGEKPVPSDTKVDLSAINNGDWTVMCMTGHYNNPVSALYRIREKQGIFTQVKVSRWTSFRMNFGEPPPCCTGMAFTDRSHQLHYLRLTGGFESFKALVGDDDCILRANPVWKPAAIRQQINQ